MGLLNDHAGKKSSSRLMSLLAMLTLCAVALGVVFWEGAEPSETMLWTLATVAVGPVGFNRWFGETK